MSYKRNTLIVSAITIGLLLATLGVLALNPMTSARAGYSPLGQGVKLHAIEEHNIERQESSVGLEETASQTQTEPISPIEAITQTDFAETTFVLAPAIHPELFVDCVDNPYFPLIPGTSYEYRTETDEGTEVTTVTVTTQTKEIMGISATVVRDTVTLNGELKEDTFDWYAQDDRGNVWYLGEDTKKYENGEVATTSGSFEAGVDGARAGIVMPGNPRPGDIYRQEYYPDHAMDMGAILSLGEPVSVSVGDFESALITADHNPLDSQLEHKFYVPGIGMVKEIVVGGDETTELVSISHDSSQIQAANQVRACGSNGGMAFVGTIFVGNQQQSLENLAQITVAQAEEAALSLNPSSQVQETNLGAENGFLAYKVVLNNGSEVLIDAGDGTILTINEGG